MKISQILPENRPIERLNKLGPSALSDAELLAIILRTGTKNKNVIDLSNEILSKFGLAKLTDCSSNELSQINGIGKTKSSQILALFELSRRITQAKTNITKITCAKDVYNYMQPKIGHLKQEVFVVILLDSKNNIIKDEIIAKGTLNSTLIHPREIFKLAIKESANSIILVHNHPSGDPTPSEQDIGITKKLDQASDLINLDLADHIIIGKNKWWSWEESEL
jgi:DNA repair protein RadC